jgi:drug/metabolite transporter, DME family
MSLLACQQGNLTGLLQQIANDSEHLWNAWCPPCSQSSFLMVRDMSERTLSGDSAKGAWLIVAAAMLWGTTGTSQALAPAGSSPQAIGALRLLVGGLTLALIALWRNGWRRQAWPAGLTFLAGFFVAAYQLCFFSGVSRTGVAVGTIVSIGSSIIFAGILEIIFQKRKPGRRWAVATLIAISGCSILLLQSRELHVNGSGIVLAAAAGFSYAAYTMTIKRLLPEKSVEDVAAMVFCVGALILSPLLFTTDLHWLSMTRGWLLMLHLGVLATGLAYWLFARGLERVPVASAVTLSLAEPMTAAVLGVVVVGERLTGSAWIGVLLILSGLLVLIVPAGIRRARPVGCD